MMLWFLLRDEGSRPLAVGADHGFRDSGSPRSAPFATSRADRSPRGREPRVMRDVLVQLRRVGPARPCPWRTRRPVDSPVRESRARRLRSTCRATAGSAPTSAAAFRSPSLRPTSRDRAARRPGAHAARRRPRGASPAGCTRRSSCASSGSAHAPVGGAVGDGRRLARLPRPRHRPGLRPGRSLRAARPPSRAPLAIVPGPAVGVLALAFALGTGFDFDTYGIVPTSIVRPQLC